MCGCGTPTKLVMEAGGGYHKGDHCRYVLGHQHSRSPLDYIIDPKTGCWIWQKARGCSQGPDKYGILRSNGTYIRAHRFYYEQINGPIPKGMDLDHLCHNTLCVNPDHLEPVTHAVNVQRGSAARLTPEDVYRARVMRLAGASVKEIAEYFDYGRGAMSQLLRGLTWRNVPMPKPSPQW